MTENTFTSEVFRELISKRARALLSMVYFLAEHYDPDNALTRPFLGELLSQATQIEELLDAYGARNNRLWRPFRSLTATLKLFSNVSYELLHIQHVLPAYKLLPVEKDFVKATETTLRFTGSILNRASKRMAKQAKALNFPTPPHESRDYSENLPFGRLPQDHSSRKIETVAKTVTLLATAFLNLSAESKQILPTRTVNPEDFNPDTASPITEENLRSLQLRFHNLQSMYDTFVSKTETEGLDKDLPVLRGHISIVFHLLKTATDFSHYYERHVDRQSDDSSAQAQPMVDPEELLGALTDYSISFVIQYLTCAERLCREMLKRYTEIEHIEVTVPQYRGFHVRPSTLISKLVLHYGSTVEMRLAEERYDAGSPLELFRANEKINAHKRKWLAEEIIRLHLIPDQPQEEDIKSIVRDVLLTLVERSKLIVYEHPLQIEEQIIEKNTKLLEYVTDEIAKLQVTGKIDIGTDLKVEFVGDKRVLADIKVLAESGYGEDNFGNNVPLPQCLAYLRR